MSKKPTVLMILDGFGLNEKTEGNAVAQAKTQEHKKLNVLMLMFGIVIGCLLMKLAVYQILNKLKIRKNLYNVRIVNGDSKIETVALEDTGNSLREPYKGRPVSVLQYNVIKQILTGNEKCFLIPFKSVGSQNGILTGITVDYMEIKNRDINLKISNPVLGIYKGMFNNDKKYQMLLNSEFILHNSETNQKQIGDCENCNMHSQF